MVVFQRLGLWCQTCAGLNAAVIVLVFCVALVVLTFVAIAVLAVLSPAGRADRALKVLVELRWLLDVLLRTRRRSTREAAEVEE